MVWKENPNKLLSTPGAGRLWSEYLDLCSALGVEPRPIKEMILFGQATPDLGDAVFIYRQRLKRKQSGRKSAARMIVTDRDASYYSTRKSMRGKR
jgi:hypothetical protein